MSRRNQNRIQRIALLAAAAGVISGCASGGSSTPVKRTPVKIEVGAIGFDDNATFSEEGDICVNETEENGCGFDEDDDDDEEDE